ncbi:MAG TPA: phosphatidate cytidylyltransferase [Spirochaetia bacterium]|nr:phosphatidate cytidylyltransferase [Spirochaetia bacterium]
MKKFFLRIALILITFPLLFALLFLLPHLHFLALALFISIATFIGAFEIKNLLEKQTSHRLFLLPPLLGATLPFSAYLMTAGIVSAGFTLKWLSILLTILFLWAIGAHGLKKEDLSKLLSKASSSVLVLIYPGFFLSFIVLMTKWQHASYKILFFLCLIFANDMVAYITGKLFGKSRNLIISPNKTTIGFVSGLLSSIGVSVLFFYLLPWLFHTHLAVILLLGFGIGVATILGDLVESAFKRSVDVKDSGTIMMGRGGILDSLDSMLLSAPFFFITFQYVFRQVV